MPRPKKKDPKQWTTDEAMKRLFPKPFRDTAKELAEEPVKPQVKSPKPSIRKENT